MFETAELGHSLSKDEYKAREPALRQELLAIQQDLRSTGDFPVIIVFAGVDGAGKGETVNLLYEWMDPRWLLTHAYGEPSQEESERPEFWRYWRDLPPRGRIGMFLSAWYSRPVLDRVYGRISEAELDDALERIAAFERALAEDGALIIKLWMHLGKKQQKARLKALEKDPLLSWRVTEADWEHWNRYDSFVVAAERAIMHTSTGHAPWHIVEGEDPRYRSITVGTLIRDAVRAHQAHRQALRDVVSKLAQDEERGDGTPEPVMVSSGQTILSALDMDLCLDKAVYDKELKRWQGELNRLYRKALQQKVSTIVVFEGWDAAGKGGAIRRCTAALDARHYQVIPVAAPTDEERARHYLWRFWRHLARAGRIRFFDRSWYGRVLVERIEGFAREGEWRRAYAEINDFEEQLVEHGYALVKFWLHITKDEQLKRFQDREATPWKRWKLTDEDWRNRDRWDLYEVAVHDMIERTSTRLAPWTLVEANDKRFGRIKVLKTVCASMARVVEGVR